MSTLEITTKLGQIEPTTYKGTESASTNVKLVGDLQKLDTGKVISYMGSVLSAKDNIHIGSFSYKRSVEDDSSKNDNVSTSIYNGKYINLNSEAAELLNQAVTEFEQSI